MKHDNRTRGFTLVELAIGIALIGLVLLAFAGMATVVQRSAGRTKQYSDAQQNARAALDYLTETLRAAGSDIAAFEGQTTVVHAAPYQVGFNADLDQGATINGDAPMTAIDVDQAYNTVPSSGSPFYTPAKTFNSNAETIVLTLDSSGDGAVDNGDHGDDTEENGRNTHLYVLKRYSYGKVTGSSNTVRDQSVAMLRGPIAYPNGDNPPPLFEYYYNDDSDLTTPDKLWGDADADGDLNSGEIGSLVAMPDSILYQVRMVKINVVAEGNAINKIADDNEGFVNVVMTSRVWMRNVDIRESARIYGVVYYDANADGTRDNGEPGIPKVLVRLGNNGRKTTTDAYGNYNIPIGGGTYTVTETDPVGYNSTTPNDVSVVVNPGEKYRVDFGDDAGSEFGYIVGTVWDDVDKSTIMDNGEVGIPGVVIQLSNEMSVKTSPTGYYRFTVPLGSYTVTETDLEGYTSTTANAVNAFLAAQGDSVTVNFGDVAGDATGTLAGHVYEDADEDGKRDFGENGIADVAISLSSGQATVTDADGYYQFDLKAGKYDIYELDPDGYTSTTPNLVPDIWMKIDSTVTVDFGDIPIKDLDFVEILVSDTDRPLSLAVGDFKEDTKADTDIVLGTPTSGGGGNTFFYINKWVDLTSPVSGLFDSTPTHVRNAGTDVNAIAAFDMTGDGFLDVMTGQESYTGNNVLEWYNDGSGSVGNSADGAVTSGLSSATTRFRIVDVDRDGRRDVLVGHRSQLAPFTGGFETLQQIAPATFYASQTVTTNAFGNPLGVVTALALGDLDKDNRVDLAVGSNVGDYWGTVDLFFNDGTGQLVWGRRLLAKAGVNAVAIADVIDDKFSLPDLLVGISEAQNAGGVQIWANRGGTFGVADTTGFSYDQDTAPRVPTEYFDAGGEVLAISTASLDGDIYPEILVGTRSSIFYTGDLLLVQRISGSVSVENIKINIAGEVVTIDFADFNKDADTDIVVTTRTSATSGKLAIYFLDGLSVVP